MSAPTASIIVCTRNRAELLGNCLSSILSDASSVERELIVIDNASTDDTEAVVRRAAATSPVPISFITEPQLGHSYARNAGVASARGSLLLFTDDDVLVESGWADGLVAPFADMGIGAVGGRIIPLWPTPPPKWLDGPHARLLTLIDYGEIDRPFADDEYVIGANMAVRAEIARRYDPPFDTRLGHSGDTRMGHEEVHFMNRVRETHAVVYAAGAVVQHRVDPERIDLNFMRRTFLELGVGLGRRERIEGAAQLPLTVRVVRAWRTVTGARRSAKENDRRDRIGLETWDELYGLMWAGKHVEMLFGRFPRLIKRLIRLAARTI